MGPLNKPILGVVLFPFSRRGRGYVQHSHSGVLLATRGVNRRISSILHVNKRKDPAHLVVRHHVAASLAFLDGSGESNWAW